MRRRRARTRFGVAAVLLCGVLACAPFWAAEPAGATSGYAVQISNYAFAPATMTVRVGDTITWTNHDQAPHNIVTTSAPTSINGPIINKGQSWSYTFTVAGTYRYICGVHPDMHATVVVRSAAPATSTAASMPSTTPAKQHVGSSMAMPATSSGPASSHRIPHSTAAAALSPSSPSSPSPSQPASATPPAAGTQPNVPPPAASGISTARIKPLLLVAGVIVAVTVFCLLALAPRPASDPASGRPANGLTPPDTET